MGRGRRRTAGVGLALVTALVTALGGSLSGCSDLRAQLDGAEAPADPDRSWTRLPPVLETVEWAATDGLVSVVVRNDDDRVLRTAEASLRALDSDGALLGTYGISSMGGDSACCTVLSLAPGQEFGLYFAVGPGADRIDEVELTYSRLAWGGDGEVPAGDPSAAPAQDAADTGVLRARAIDTVIQRDQTVVIATVRVGARDLPRALVQAVLRGPDGTLVAVVTGRWSCLAAQSRRRLRMELFQPVPVGTEVDTVTVRPLEDTVSPRCAI